MENLSYPKMQFLMNTLTVKDFGYKTFTDPDTGATVKNLYLKNHNGIMIPYVSTTYNSVKVSNTKDGAYKSILIKILAPAPCASCHYEYEVDVHRKWKQPGSMNDDYYAKAKSFGGVIEAIQTPSGGFLADSDIQTMEDTIMAGVENDQKGFNSTREPNIVHAKRLYTFVPPLATTNIITCTINGTATSVAMTTNTTTLTMVNDINSDATVGASLVAFALSTTVIAITALLPATTFTIADGGGATTLASITRYIWMYSKYYDPKFYVDFRATGLENGFGWATVTAFNVLVLNNTSSAAGDTTKFAIAGTTSGAINHNTTSSTYAASIVSSTLGTGGSAPHYLYASATKTAGSVPVYVYSSTYEMVVVALPTAGCTVTAQYSGKGVWPSLSWTDVFNVFLNQRGMDKHSNFIYLDQVGPDTEWNKLVLEYYGDSAAIHGASHRDNYKMRVEVYIAQGYGGTNLWYSGDYMAENTTDNGSFSVDTTINGLIDAWSGLTHGTDYKAII